LLYFSSHLKHFVIRFERKYPIRRSLIHSSHAQKSPEWSFVRADCVKKEIAQELLVRTRSTFSNSLMVSVGVSKLGQTQLIFVDPAVKIDDAYYRDVLLTQQLLPVMHENSGDFILQQDSAPRTQYIQTSWTGDNCRDYCVINSSWVVWVNYSPPTKPRLNGELWWTLNWIVYC